MGVSGKLLSAENASARCHHGQHCASASALQHQTPDLQMKLQDGLSRPWQAGGAGGHTLGSQEPVLSTGRQLPDRGPALPQARP